MAKIIDDETMENVCILAKLSLSEEEKEKAKAEMQKMLDYVEKLDELDTSEVEPMSHIFQDENVFREDVVTNGDNKEAMLANAPKAKEGQYQVPKTIDRRQDNGVGKINSPAAWGKNKTASGQRPGWSKNCFRTDRETGFRSTRLS